MSIIHNPIIPSFNPNPCILRIGEEYYITSSTFKWFSDITLYYSRDLAHWHLIGHALMRPSQLDLRDIHCSEDVWASDLSFCESEQQLYLTYTIIRNWGHDGPRDMHNYLVTSKCPKRPWSDPIFSNEYLQPMYFTRAFVEL